jgi:polysaccharide export outer membrane protein
MKPSSIAIAAFVLFLSGCLGGRLSPLDELELKQDNQTAYLVQRGDTLTIKVWGEPQLSGDNYVRDDGRFTMPLINDVEAQGKTLEAIAAEVTEKLIKYVPGATVTVSISQSAPIRFYLSGSFNKAGEYRSSSRVTFLQAIASGGGFAPFADDSSLTLIRKTAEGEKRYSLNYSRVVDGSQPNPELRDGDVIAVK